MATPPAAAAVATDTTADVTETAFVSTGRPKRRSLTVSTVSRKRRKVEPQTTARSRSPLIAYPSSSVRQPAASVSYKLDVPAGVPLLLGCGDTGQLGLGPNVIERVRPSRFNKLGLDSLTLDETTLDSAFTQVCAGGMHTVLLTKSGRVVTFGCNDEGALGRTTAAGSTANAPEAETRGEQLEEPTAHPIIDETVPGYALLPLTVKISMVSAGDSHTAALDSTGQIWLWGTFRGSSGPIGLTQVGEISQTPKPLLSPDSKLSKALRTGVLLPSMRVIKITSGQDHLVLLTDEGRLYTMGCGEQGQLGRVAERFARTGGRGGLTSLLCPTECRIRGSVRFSNVWAGGFGTFALCQNTGVMYACGLNNYGQLAFAGPGGYHHRERASLNGLDETLEEDPVMPADAERLISDREEADRSEAALIARQGPLIEYMLNRAFGFQPELEWKQLAVAMHHTLALDKDGIVYAVGRPEYGRLGLGKVSGANAGVSVTTLTRVGGPLLDKVCTWVGCGGACSFAVDTSGAIYSWGIGNSNQLGHGDDDDSYEPVPMQGKQLEDRCVSIVDAGGQHTVLLAHSRSVANLMNVEMSTSKVDQCLMDTAAPRNNHATTVPKSDDLPSTTDVCMTECLDAPIQPSQLSKHDFPSPVVVVSSTLDIAVPVRRRHGSPTDSTANYSSLICLGTESTTGSTACATFNSSVHSFAVSDTSSVGSCASSTSTTSQPNSAKSTDGGGSSRCSSFGTFSVQSSTLQSAVRIEDPTNSIAIQPAEVAPMAAPSIFRGPNSTNSSYTGAIRLHSAGMSVCSTSSEPGIPVDALSVGSTATSPVTEQLISNDQGSS